MSGTVYTLGHSNLSIEEFLSIVRLHNIEAIGDVRSTPRSRYHPHFDAESLEIKLRENGVDYVFLGRNLGGRPTAAELYFDGHADYDAMSRTHEFRRDLKRLVRVAGRQRIALLCSEKDPLTCHRGLLVARRLEELGVPVCHIHRDGSVETHQEAEGRLMRETGGVNGSLIKGPEEVLCDAYSMRAAQVAYQQNTGQAIRSKTT